MISEIFRILLAEDDNDDSLFFKEALEELQLDTELKIIHDGEKLMELLNDDARDLPHVVFLDLNMPRKNGFECLSEIRSNPRLQHLPVIIVSTSFEQEIVDGLYRDGAHYYIRKPADFAQIRKVVYQSIRLVSDGTGEQPPQDQFVVLIDANTE